jgi:integrase
MANKSELIEAAWREFDLGAALWTIPASCAGNGLARRVPLSRQALTMLGELRDMEDSRKYVFPSTRGDVDRPIAKGTLNQAVKTLGLEVEHFVLNDVRRTGFHYLRDALRSVTAEQPAVESHNAVTADEMQRWADFVDLQYSARAPGKAAD